MDDDNEHERELATVVGRALARRADDASNRNAQKTSLLDFTRYNPRDA